MKNLKNITFVVLSAALTAPLSTHGIFTVVNGTSGQLSLNNGDKLNLFLRGEENLERFFNNKKVPDSIEEYKRHVEELNKLSLGPYCHIHPNFLLMSTTQVVRLNLQLNKTYQVNPNDPKSPKFRVQEILEFDYIPELYGIPNSSEFRLSLVKIGPGDLVPSEIEAISLAERKEAENKTDAEQSDTEDFAEGTSADFRVENLVDLEPIKLYQGHPEEMEKVAETMQLLKELIDELKNPKDLVEVEGETIKKYEILNTLLRGDAVLNPVADLVNHTNSLRQWIQNHFKGVDQTIKNRMDFLKTKVIGFAFARSIQRSQAILASNIAQNGMGRHISDAHIVAALANVNQETFNQDSDGRTVQLELLSSTPIKEENLLQPFDFYTFTRGDEGQPIYVFEDGEYYLVSLNQQPDGKHTSFPVFFQKGFFDWVVKVTGDDYFQTTYPELSKYLIDEEEENKDNDKEATSPGSPRDDDDNGTPATPVDEGTTATPATPVDEGDTTSPATPTDEGTTKKVTTTEEKTTSPATPVDKGDTTSPATPTDEGTTKKVTTTEEKTTSPATPTDEGATKKVTTKAKTTSPATPTDEGATKKVTTTKAKVAAPSTSKDTAKTVTTKEKGTPRTGDRAVRKTTTTTTKK